MKLKFRDDKHAEVELDQPRLTIGRDQSNDIVLDHDDISGFHAEIHLDDGKLYLVDLASSNGTWRQGSKIQGRVELKVWDEIAFASLRAELVDPDKRRPTKAMPAISDDQLAAPKPASARVGDIDKTRARLAVGGWVLIGLSDDVKGDKQPLAGTMTVGRDADCDLPLANELASRKHARLLVEGNRLLVEDLGSTNGTWINGRKTSGRAEVQNGDELRFDTTRFKATSTDLDINKTAARPAVAATAARPVADGEPAARLRPDGGRPFELTKGTSIGRLPDNDVVLDDDTVSGHHARLEREADHWKLTDLGSSNGTEIDGKKVKTAILRGGERIAFGEVELTFEAARSGGTRHITAIDGATTSTGTRQQQAVSGRQRPTATTRTSQHASASLVQTLPAWAWGLIGFFIVIVGFGTWMFRDYLGFAPGQIDAPLQAATTWQKRLGSGEDPRRVVASPVLADVNGDGFLGLIVADISGFVTAFDGQEGKEIFSVAVPGRVVAAVNAVDLTGDGAEEVVVGTASGRVLALNQRGQTVWESSSDNDLGEITNRPVFARVNEDEVPDVLVPTSRRGLVALDGARGWEIWSTAEMTQGSVLSSPVAGDFNEDGAVDFAFLTDQGQAVAVSTSESRVLRLWSTADLGQVDYASPALLRVGKQQLLVIATRSGVSALDAASGRMAWANRSGDTYIASPLGIAVSEKRAHDVVLVSAAGLVRLLSGSSGDEIWRLNLGQPVSASPAAFDFTGDGLKDLLFQSATGRLVVIDSQRGRAVLETDQLAAAGITASPVIGDLTRDGLLEASLIDEQGNIRVLTMNRTLREGQAAWPRMLGNDQHSVQW